MRYLPHPSKCISCRIAYPGVDVVPNANWNFCSPYLAALSAVLLATTQPATANSRRTDAQQGGIEYYRTIRLDYEGSVTHFGVYISKPEQETPPGFREFLEGAARPGYERITSFMQADIESGKVTVK